MESLRTLLGLDEFICGKRFTKPTSGGISNLRFQFGIPTPLVTLWNFEKFNTEQLKSRIKRQASTLING